MSLWSLLKEKNINYEELTAQEKETLETWLRAVQQNEITVDKIRDYLQAMKDAVATELAVPDLVSGQDTFLKARLKNYILLLAFLTSPEKAKKALEEAIKRLPTK